MSVDIDCGRILERKEKSVSQKTPTFCVQNREKKHPQLVLPDAGFKRLTGVRSQRAEAGQAGAGDRVLVAPGLVLVHWLEESHEAGVCAVDERLLVRSPQVQPVHAPRGVLAVEVRLAHPARQRGQAEVVVRVLEGARDAAGVGAEAHGVEVEVGDVVERLPTLQAAAPMDRPLQRLVLSVVDDGLQRELPVDAGREVLDKGVHQHHVRVAAALRPALAEGHVAVREPAFVLVDVQQRPQHL